MAADYIAKRRNFSSRTTYMHHIAWGVVCVLLIAVVFGLWQQIQLLSNQNATLKQQLNLAQQPTSNTCKVYGDWKPATTKTKLIGDRAYLVHTPKDFKPDQYYPLLLFYPGKGASAEAAQAAYGLDTLPAVVVYPYPTLSKDGFLAWEGAPYSSNSGDVTFTAAILDKLQAELCIDRTRIYAAGMSNGGGFASLLSCTLPNRIAAYAIVSGALYSPLGNCKPPRAAPIITIHGDSDPIVPYEGSPTRQLPPIYSWTAGRAAYEKCSKPSTNYLDALTEVTTWNNCISGTKIQNIRILSGGHVWGQVPNDYLWQFLSQFSL